MAEELVSAALYGTVSASFTIEQGGLPQITKHSSGELKTEEWNGDSPWKRLDEVRKRCKMP
jgi:hypothetical protein